MSTLASDIINTVRDQIPDPSYTSAGVVLPQSDGDLFRAQTLVRWINEGVNVVAQQTGWTTTDWTALAMTTNQPFYTVDSKFKNVQSVYVKELPLTFLDEINFILPTQLRSNQPSWWGIHRETDHLEIALLPIPNASISDPQTTLTTTFNTTDTSMAVASTASFNSYGYLQVNNNEIVAYQVVSGNTVLNITHAQAGTTAVQAVSGNTVQHLGCWLKGTRSPVAVTSSNSVVELDESWTYCVQLYVLSKCYFARNNGQEGRAFQQQFTSELARIKADPSWKMNQGLQIQSYDEHGVGPLAFGRVITT